MEETCRCSNVHQIMGFFVHFPKKKSPFPSQKAVMSKVLLALQTSKHGILESPTGSGKTLALLCATLVWQKQQKKNILRDAMHQVRSDVDLCFSTSDSDFENTIEQFRMSNVKKRKRGTSKSSVTLSTLQKKSKDKKVSTTTTPKDEKVSTTTTPKDEKVSVEKGLEEKELMTTTTMMQDDLKKETHPYRKTVSSKSSLICNGKKASKIYFASRTHSQLAQVVEELRDSVQYLCEYQPKMLILGSRNMLCVNDKVQSKQNINEMCQDLMSSNSCSFFKKVPALSHYIPDICDIEELVVLGKEHRGCPYYYNRSQLAAADIVLCPYNYILDPITRKAMNIDLTDAIVILDEAHNIEDMCREGASCSISIANFKVCQEELAKLEKTYEKRDPSIFKSCILLLEMIGPLLELLDDLTNELSVKSFEEEIKTIVGHEAIAMLGVKGVLTPQNFSNLYDSFLTIKNAEKNSTELFSKSIQKNGVLDGALDGALDAADLPEVMSTTTPFSKSKPNRNIKLDYCLSGKSLLTLESFFTSLQFMLRNDMKDVDDFVLALKKEKAFPPRMNFNSWQYTLCLWCLNPAVAFADVVQPTRSLLLTSGTLSPMDSFASELGVDFGVRLEANHVIKVDKQLWIGSVASGPNQVDLLSKYGNQQGFTYQDALGQTIQQYTQVIPGGMLVFLPSYSLLDKLSKRWKSTGLWNTIDQKKEIFVEPREPGKTFDTLLEQYRLSIIENTLPSTPTDGKTTDLRNGALFFAVFRGKVSEGIDFSDDNARGVIVIGIPFPNFKDSQITLKMEYQNSQPPQRKLLKGKDWYRHQAFRALNQAIGRCIRHSKDYGAIILLDPRYRETYNTKDISKWARPCIRHYINNQSTLEPLRNFFHSLSWLEKDIKQETCWLQKDIKQETCWLEKDIKQETCCSTSSKNNKNNSGASLSLPIATTCETPSKSSSNSSCSNSSRLGQDDTDFHSRNPKVPGRLMCAYSTKKKEDKKDKKDKEDKEDHLTVSPKIESPSSFGISCGACERTLAVISTSTVGYNGKGRSCNSPFFARLFDCPRGKFPMAHHVQENCLDPYTCRGMKIKEALSQNRIDPIQLNTQLNTQEKSLKDKNNKKRLLKDTNNNKKISLKDNDKNGVINQELLRLSCQNSFKFYQDEEDILSFWVSKENIALEYLFCWECPKPRLVGVKVVGGGRDCIEKIGQVWFDSTSTISQVRWNNEDFFNSLGLC